MSISRTRRSTVEVFPVAVDPTGLWLLGEAPWVIGNCSGDPHVQVQAALARYGLLPHVELVLPVMTRTDGDGVTIHSFLAALVPQPTDSLVLGAWTSVEPLTRSGLDRLGLPGRGAHGPAVERYADVLVFALWQMEDHIAWSSSPTASPHWGPHLAGLGLCDLYGRPALTAVA